MFSWGIDESWEQVKKILESVCPGQRISSSRLKKAKERWFEAKKPIIDLMGGKTRVEYEHKYILPPEEIENCVVNVYDKHRDVEPWETLRWEIRPKEIKEAIVNE